MSASVTTDRARIRRRGTLLAYIFANQGWGSLVGSLVVIIVLLCYKGVMDGEGKTSKVDGVWRICVGLSLVPAFGTLYQRLTLPESTRFKEMRKGAHEESGHGGGSGSGEDEIAELKRQQQLEEMEKEGKGNGGSQESSSPTSTAPESGTNTVDDGASKQEVDAKNEHFKGASPCLLFIHMVRVIDEGYRVPTLLF